MQSWDYLIVGSGFGGSVSALRLVEKGHRVLMLEKGRRFAPGDFARSNWNLRRWMWMPRLGLRGPFQMRFLRHITALSGVGVGGGSLVYANTLPVPGDGFFNSPAWRHLADWKAELAPAYQRARRMLGVVPYPHVTFPDEVLGELARDLGLEAQFHPTDVGVFFGEPGVTVPDPYFGGDGPARTGCIECGGCMLGCRFGAKNTLDRNYLYLAEKRGLRIEPEHEVEWIRPVEGGYEVTVLAGPVRWWRRRTRRVFHARNVVLAGGVLGTVPLLLRLKRSVRGLPRLSERLGEFVRTNSEVLMGIVSERRDRRMSDGIAITSILKTDEHSTLEPVRYPAGSGFFRMLMAPHGPGATAPERIWNALRFMAANPRRALKAWLVPDFARHTLIMLYMRSIDSYLTLRPGRLFGRVRSVLTHGPAPTAAIPEATELADRIAAKVDGFPGSLATETLLGIPTTAHILGGCVMGDSRETGVIGVDHQVWGYPGLYVVDGSAISANPGVNPSLTICALAERAMERMLAKEEPLAATVRVPELV
ncbi:MAG TPA: GMC family oxidoreductase [Longimicrobium sp.]|jgi:cholesterol oxidase|nr:GMC family oxidoreductase [Longimicrobium sp.]